MALSTLSSGWRENLIKRWLFQDIYLLGFIYTAYLKVIKYAEIYSLE